MEMYKSLPANWEAAINAARSGDKCPHCGEGVIVAFTVSDIGKATAIVGYECSHCGCYAGIGLYKGERWTQDVR